MSKLKSNFHGPTEITKYAMELLRDHGIGGVKAAGVRLCVKKIAAGSVQFRIEVVTDDGKVLSYIDSPQLYADMTFALFDAHRVFEMHVTAKE